MYLIILEVLEDLYKGRILNYRFSVRTHYVSYCHWSYATTTSTGMSATTTCTTHDLLVFAILSVASYCELDL